MQHGPCTITLQLDPDPRWKTHTPQKTKRMPDKSGDTQNWIFRCSPRLVSTDDPPTWGGNLHTLHNLLTWTYTLRDTSGRWTWISAGLCCLRYWADVQSGMWVAANIKRSKNAFKVCYYVRDRLLSAYCMCMGPIIGPGQMQLTALGITYWWGKKPWGIPCESVTIQRQTTGRSWWIDCWYYLFLGGGGVERTLYGGGIRCVWWIDN